MFEAIGLETFKDLIETALVIVPLVTGLTTVVKRTLELEKRYVPATAVVIGALAGIVVIEFSLAGGTAGIVVGLAATGLWEVGKQSFKKSENKPIRP